MAACGITMDDLGPLLGFRDRHPLWSRFSGSKPWTLTEMYRLADVLGIPEERLLEYFPRNGGAGKEIKQ